MANDPQTITLGFVNCYLIKTDMGFFLIDSGVAMMRSKLLSELKSAGCKPGNLKLVILTHGDPDHSGNAAYLQRNFGAKIVLHPGEAAMIERGNMLYNRKTDHPLSQKIIQSFFSFLLPLRKADRFTADIWANDSCHLSTWDLDVQIVHNPGHSNGSIGVLTPDGTLFCGDLLHNNGTPSFWAVDDQAAANNSVLKLKILSLNMVYPGHGKPFRMALFTTPHSAGSS